MDTHSSLGGRVSAGLRVARNVGSSYGLRGLRALSVLVLTPYLFRSLGVDGFGSWSILFTVGTIFALVELGATVGVTKQVAEQEDVRELVGVSAGLMAGLGVLALAVSLPLALLADGLVPERLADPFAAGMVIIGAAQLVRFPGQAYGATLMGLQRYDLFNAGEAATVLSFVAGAVAAIELGGGIAGLAAAYGGSLVLGAVVWVGCCGGTGRTCSPRRGSAARRCGARCSRSARARC